MQRSDRTHHPRNARQTKPLIDAALYWFRKTSRDRRTTSRVQRGAMNTERSDLSQRAGPTGRECALMAQRRTKGSSTTLYSVSISQVRRRGAGFSSRCIALAVVCSGRAPVLLVVFKAEWGRVRQGGHSIQVDPANMLVAMLARACSS